MISLKWTHLNIDTLCITIMLHRIINQSFWELNSRPPCLCFVYIKVYALFTLWGSVYSGSRNVSWIISATSIRKCCWLKDSVLLGECVGLVWCLSRCVCSCFCGEILLLADVLNWCFAENYSSRTFFVVLYSLSIFLCKVKDSIRK